MIPFPPISIFNRSILPNVLLSEVVLNFLLVIVPVFAIFLIVHQSTLLLCFFELHRQVYSRFVLILQFVVQNHRRIPEGIKLDRVLLFDCNLIFSSRRWSGRITQFLIETTLRIYIHELLRILNNSGQILFLIVLVMSLEHTSYFIFNCLPEFF